MSPSPNMKGSTSLIEHVPALSPFHLNQYTREVWSEYDAYVLAILEPALRANCYTPKIYKAPDITQEVITPDGYVQYGLKITPGALWIGYIFPSDFEATEIEIQITDMGLDHRRYSDPVPWYIASNGKMDMPNLQEPHPIVAPGLLIVEFWNVTDSNFRTQLQLIALEPK
jgi:hypothetical protein